jgi:hypothetical protein
MLRCVASDVWHRPTDEELDEDKCEYEPMKRPSDGIVSRAGVFVTIRFIAGYAIVS